jgi:hypothetical protein
MDSCAPDGRDDVSIGHSHDLLEAGKSNRQECRNCSKWRREPPPIQQVFESLDCGEIQKWVPKHQVGFDHRCQVTMRKQGNGICS